MKLSKIICSSFIAASAFSSQVLRAEDDSLVATDAVDLSEDMEAAQGAFDTQEFVPVTCYVSNARGQTFTAVGPNPQLVGQRAYNKCARVSVRCTRPICRY